MAEKSLHVGPPQARDLDDPALYSQIDPTGLGSRLRGFPHQCRRAWEEAMAYELPHAYEKVGRVVVAGMGGSAIGGELLGDLVRLEDSLAISVCRDYQLPASVDEGTLVLACSYSGETEETLSCFRQALCRGARVIAVTTGGTIAAEARERDVPLFTVTYRGEPRTALGYSFLVPTVLLMRLGLILDRSGDFNEAVGVLEGLAPELAEKTPSADNPAKRMASALVSRAIVVYGSGIFSGVARRWKTQFNENSKVWATFEQLPEAHHNSVVGYSLPEDVRARTFAILLRPANLHPRIGLRYRVTRDLLAREAIDHQVVEGRGGSALSQILSTVLIGDYVSYYLAIAQGIDPSPVPNIEYVKGRIATETCP